VKLAEEHSLLVGIVG